MYVISKRMRTAHRTSTKSRYNKLILLAERKKKKNWRNLIRAQIIICEMNKHRKRIKLFVNSKIVFFFLIKPDNSSKKYLSPNYTPFKNNLE